MLVPEIGLTPQAVARFGARLGDRVAVLHSALAPGERYDEWRRLRSGEASVCVGPRSAVFAPVRDLGLIVIDEEHDPSYKQEGDPCYDARAVARRRGRGLRRRARQRVGDAAAGELAALPRLELPPARRRPPPAAGRGGRHARAADPRSGPLHADTFEALEERPPLGREGDRDDQPPRLRSLADLPLLRAPLGLPQLRRLADRPPPRAAPRLPPLRPRRAAAGSLPGVRLDDARAGRRRHRADRGAACASGWRRCRSSASTPTAPPAAAPTPASSPASARPKAASWSAPRWSARATTSREVTLSAILDADATLRFPDFRAEERTFAMVAQLAGRSGRGEAGGG